MVSVETIREQFDDLGFTPSDEVIDKCKNRPVTAKFLMFNLLFTNFL